jgi:hypothetical protein
MGGALFFLLGRLRLCGEDGTLSLLAVACHHFFLSLTPTEACEGASSARRACIWSASSPLRVHHCSRPAGDVLGSLGAETTGDGQRKCGVWVSGTRDRGLGIFHTVI